MREMHDRLRRELYDDLDDKTKQMVGGRDLRTSSKSLQAT